MQTSAQNSESYTTTGCAIDKSDLLKLLSDTNTRVLAYHNHKELSAWAGIILLFTFSASMIQCADKHLGTRHTLSIVNVLIAFLAFYYVRLQLRLREEFSHFTHVLPRACFELLGKTKEEIMMLDCSMEEITPHVGTLSWTLLLPAFLKGEPYATLAKLKRKPRIALERVAYALIIITTMTTEYVIWYSGFRK